MYGGSIEQDFPHIAFEQEQLRHKFEMQRLFEANQPQPQRTRRSLATIFARRGIQRSGSRIGRTSRG